MKTPDWQFNMVGDYGRRTDYQAFSNETAGGHANYKGIQPKEYWVQTKKHVVKCANLLNNRGIPYRIPMKTFWTWNEVFKGIWDHGVSNFSLGMFCIMMSLEFLKTKEIFLVGFDNLLHPDMDVYYKAHRGKWNTGHNWKAENEFLHILLNHYKAEYRDKPWESETK